MTAASLSWTSPSITTTASTSSNVTSKAELDGLAAEYSRHSEARGIPAILATPARRRPAAGDAADASRSGAREHGHEQSTLTTTTASPEPSTSCTRTRPTDHAAHYIGWVAGGVGERLATPAGAQFP